MKNFVNIGTTILVLFLLLVIICTSCSMGKMKIPAHDVQVRVYVDRGFQLPDKSKGMFVQAYGIIIEPDGSEKVVWRTELASLAGLKEISNEYRFLYHKDQIYLFFPKGLGLMSKLGKTEDEIPFVLQLQSRTGKITNRMSSVPHSLKKYIWFSTYTILRPALRNEEQIFEPQRAM